MTEAQLLAQLPTLAFGFILILCRVGLVVMLLPGLGEIEAPSLLRIGLALGISLLIYARAIPEPLATAEGMQGVRMILTELMTGAAIGWMARVPAMALGMAGGVISTLLGLSSVIQPDPALGGQSTALARLFGLAAPVLILATGLYSLPLSALSNSYDLVGLGGGLPAGDTADLVVKLVSGTFGLALQLSAPFLLASVVWQVAVGLLARVAPQVQAFAVAAPGQILGGLVLLGFLASRLLTTWQDGVGAMWGTLPGS